LCGFGVVNANGNQLVLAYPSLYYLNAPSQLPLLASTDGGVSWIMLNPPGEPGFESYGLDTELMRQAIVPGAVLRGAQQGDLWEYGLFPPCSIQPMLGFGQVWAQHPELRQAAGCPLGPEQPLTLQTRHFETSGEQYDLYWAADGEAPCVQVFDHGNGQLTGGIVDPIEAAGCKARPIRRAAARCCRFRMASSGCSSPTRTAVGSWPPRCAPPGRSP
jgi:hypothetical protein